MPTRRPRPSAAAVPAVDDLRADAAPTGPTPPDAADAARPQPEAALPGPAYARRTVTAPAPPAAAAPTDVLLGAGPVGDDRIRALFAELLSLPTDQVRDALGLAGLGLELPAGGVVTASDQAFADAMADGLAHLGWLIRRHPRLARGLQWELAGLTPQAVIPPAELDAIAATARAVGASVSPARYGRFLGAGDVATSTVVELAPEAVRLVLTTVAAADTAPMPEAL